MNTLTDKPEVPANGDNLVFPASTFNALVMPDDDMPGLALSSIQVNASYTITGRVPLTLGAGGIAVNAPSPDPAVQLFTMNSSLTLSLTAPTTSMSVTTGTDLEFLSGGVLSGNSDLMVSGGGFLNFLSQTSTNTGTIVVSKGQINGGMSGGLPMPKKPKVNTAQVLPGGTLSVGGASGGLAGTGMAVFGQPTNVNPNPLGNIEVDGGGLRPSEVDVFDGNTLNTISLTGSGIINPAANFLFGVSSSGGVINVGPQVGSSDSSTPVINVNPGGLIAPGSPGTVGSLTFDASVNFSPTATLAVGFGGTGSLVADEILVPNGTVSLGGATLSVTLPSPPPIGDPVTIVEASSIQGTFAGLPDGATLRVDHIPFVVHYLFDSRFDVASVTLTRLSSPTLPPASFDGADLTDPAVYLTAYGDFAIGDSTGKTVGELVPFGIAGYGQTIPAIGDYYGYGTDDLAAYLPNYAAFFVKDPTGQTPGVVVPFGIPGAGQTIPAQGDYDGVGHSEIAAYLPGIGYYAIRHANLGTDQVFAFGIPGAGQTIPAPADYYGTGQDDIAVFLAQSATFAILAPGGQTGEVIPFGMAGLGNSIPVPGDYDGSGHTELAVYIPSLGAFFYRPYNGSTDVEVPIGVPKSGEIPVPGDYDGSGHDEVAIYDPTGGFFEYKPADGGSYLVKYFGANDGGSVPLAAPAGSLPEFDPYGSVSVLSARRKTASSPSASDFASASPTVSASAVEATPGRPSAIHPGPNPGSVRVARSLIKQAIPEPAPRHS